MSLLPHKVILLAEDSPDDEFLFLEIMRTSQIPNPVMVVHDGEDAIAYLKGHGQFTDAKTYPPPTALFLDLNMPKVGGFEVLRWIKTQPYLKDLLVIILSHHREVKNVDQAYRMGAHSFLTKPFNRKDLTSLMTHFHSHFQSGEQQIDPGVSAAQNNLRLQLL